MTPSTTIEDITKLPTAEELEETERLMAARQHRLRAEWAARCARTKSRINTCWETTREEEVRAVLAQEWQRKSRPRTNPLGRIKTSVRRLVRFCRRHPAVCAESVTAVVVVLILVVGPLVGLAVGR